MTFKDIVLKMKHIRILGMSSFELSLVLIGLILFIVVINYYKKLTVKNVIVLSIAFIMLVFSLGIIIHYIFGVNTQLNYLLGLTKCKPDYNSLSGIFDC